MTTPDEQARCAFTAEDHEEFNNVATTSERRFLKDKYGEDPTYFDSPTKFVAATAGDADPSGPSHPDPDAVAEEAMTAREKLEFRQSDHDSPADFLKDRNGVHPATVDEPGEYHRAVASLMTMPAPPTARLVRCWRCQSVATPSPRSQEYWHIGDTITRFGAVRPARSSGVKRSAVIDDGTFRSLMHPVLAANSPTHTDGRKSVRFSPASICDEWPMCPDAHHRPVGRFFASSVPDMCGDSCSRTFVRQYHSGDARRPTRRTVARPGTPSRCQTNSASTASRSSSRNHGDVNAAPTTASTERLPSGEWTDSTGQRRKEMLAVDHSDGSASTSACERAPTVNATASSERRLCRVRTYARRHSGTRTRSECASVRPAGSTPTPQASGLSTRSGNCVPNSATSTELPLGTVSCRTRVESV
jgi:hypothetical protein